MDVKPVFHQFEIGPMQNFCYLIGSNQSDEVLLVDPGWDSDLIRSEEQKLGKKITGVLCTHSHYDHVTQVPEILKTHDVPVYMLGAEVSYSNFTCENLKVIDSNYKIKVGGIEVEALHTPGHTQGSTSYKVGNYLVTGDTLFVNGCGRCDLLTGDATVMYKTLRHICDHFPSQTVILPGHDYGPVPTDSLLEQKSSNPYLKFDTLEKFLVHRTRPRS